MGKNTANKKGKQKQSQADAAPPLPPPPPPPSPPAPAPPSSVIDNVNDQPDAGGLPENNDFALGGYGYDDIDGLATENTSAADADNFNKTKESSIKEPEMSWAVPQSQGAWDSGGGATPWPDVGAHGNIPPPALGGGNPYPGGSGNQHPQSGGDGGKKNGKFNKRGVGDGKNVQWEGDQGGHRAAFPGSGKSSVINLAWGNTGPSDGQWGTNPGKKDGGGGVEPAWGMPSTAVQPSWGGSMTGGAPPSQHHRPRQQAPSAAAQPAWLSWGKEASGQKAPHGPTQRHRDALADILNYPPKAQGGQHSGSIHGRGNAYPGQQQGNPFGGTQSSKQEELLRRQMQEMQRIEQIKRQQYEQERQNQHKHGQNQHKQKQPKRENAWQTPADDWQTPADEGWGKQPGGNEWGAQKDNNGWGGSGWGDTPQENGWANTNNNDQGWDEGDEYHDEEYDDEEYDDETVEDEWNNHHHAKDTWNPTNNDHNNLRHDRRSIPKPTSINPKDLYRETKAFAPNPLSPQYDMPSKTLAHAYRGTDSKNRPFPVPPLRTFPIRSQMNDYADLKFAESKGLAIDPVVHAFFGKERLARHRLHWKFPPDKDERVSTLLAWIQAVSYHLASFGLHKFLQTRERGALFANADYQPLDRPGEPAFDWIIFDDLVESKDRVLQESVATYDPSKHVVVFVFLPSPTGKSVAIWRRKLLVPNNVKLAYQREIGIALSGLRASKDYKVYLDEAPAKSTPKPVVTTAPTKSPGTLKRALSLNRTPYEERAREKELQKKAKELQKRAKEQEKVRMQRQKELKKELAKRKKNMPAPPKFDKDGYLIPEKKGVLARIFCL